MLDALADNDMIINAVKSAVLLRHRGTFIKKWLRRHKQHTSDGDLFYLRTPKGREFRFPIREQHTYLGVKISYHAMAKHTTLYRIQAANQAWQRLRSVLCSSGRLALPHRLSLWKATVLPTLMYGLAAVDPEPKDCARLQSLIIKHVRAMAKSFAHMHYESSHRVLLRCGILSAQDQLQKETEGLLRRLRTHADSTPLVSSSHLEALRTQAAHLQAADLIPANDTTQSVGEEYGHPCQVCGRTFRSFRLLRSHEAKWHQLKTPTPQRTVFDRYEHGTDGLPTCRHCGHRFRQWANLKQHIQQNRCQVLRTRNSTEGSARRAQTGTQEEPGAEVHETGESRQESHDACQTEPSQMKVGQESSSCPGAPDSPDVGDREIENPTTATVSMTASQSNMSTKSIPLQDWPLVKQKLQAGSWTELLECSEVQAYLQHHCPICMQWAATPNGLKCHMTNQHDEWRQLQKPIQHILQSFRRHTVLPCRYCKQSRVNKDRHWQQCHVLSLCAFLWVKYDITSSGRHGSGRSGAALLPALGATIRSASRPQSSGLQPPSSELGGCQATESGGPGEEQGKRQQGKGKVQGQGRVSSPSRTCPNPSPLSCGKNVGIQQWLRRGPNTVHGQPTPKDTKSGWKREWTDSHRWSSARSRHCLLSDKT